MDYLQIADALEQNAQVFRTLLEGKRPEEYNWKPAAGKWSLLDIICHLYDEEKLDFKARVEQVLFNNKQPMPGIDPEGWVESHAYAQQHFEIKIKDFLEARAESVAWLRGLENPNWEKSHTSTFFGTMTARMFLENWLAHDYLHLRQIVKQNYDYLIADSEGDFRYAGGW